MYRCFTCGELFEWPPDMLARPKLTDTVRPSRTQTAKRFLLCEDCVEKIEDGEELKVTPEQLKKPHYTSY